VFEKPYNNNINNTQQDVPHPFTYANARVMQKQTPIIYKNVDSIAGDNSYQDYFTPNKNMRK